MTTDRPIVTDHEITVDWNNGYRATCSCGKYRSKRYPVTPIHAKRAWDSHVRAVTGKPAGCIRLREVGRG